MSLIVFLVAAMAVANASPNGFLQDTPEVQAAKQQFLLEYNRMARLAAEAPDVHIFPNRHASKTHTNTISAAPRQPNPLNSQSIYSFSANLGGNQQFFPATQFRAPILHHTFNPIPAAHPNTIPAATLKKAPQPAPSQQPIHFQQSEPQPALIHRWTGPLAHSIPAGVHGLPVQVQHTPAVQAARDAHFRALKAAYDAVLRRTPKA